MHIWIANLKSLGGDTYPAVKEYYFENSIVGMGWRVDNENLSKEEYYMVNSLLNDESIIMGIPRDNPEMTKPEDCRYDACLIVVKDQLNSHQF